MSNFSFADLDIAESERAVLVSFVDSWDDHGQPVLFVGAGMSTHGAEPPGKLKDWRGLIEDLRRELSVDQGDVTRQLERADYLRTAQLHESQFQRSRLLDAVERALPTREVSPGESHRALRALPWHAIITTNYDDLLEQTFAPTIPTVKVVADADLTRRRPAGSLLILKMHGDLADRSSIVLTEEDYRTYSSTRPGIELKIKQLLLEHPALFIGFSLADPNFAHVEGWIRDTTRGLRIQAVALVHVEPLEAERVMWAARGVRLVHVRNSETLARVFTAMRAHTARRGNDPAGTVKRNELEEEVLRVLRSRQQDWHVPVISYLASALTAEGRRTETILRKVLMAPIGGLSKLDLEGLLSNLAPELQRAVFLRAFEMGITSATAMDTETGKVTTIVDIERALIDAKLSPDERARLFLAKSALSLQRSNLEHAVNDLLVASADVHDEKLQENILTALRKSLLRLGNEALIEKHLLNGPSPKDAVGYCRRGAEVMMVRGAKAANHWYSEASKLAGSGDENTAALMGLQAGDFPEWTHADRIEQQRAAIQEEDCPKTGRVWDLRDEAGLELLTARREGRTLVPSEGVPAVRKLREALELADEMGWPRCAHPRLSTAADGLAYQLLGLYVQEDSGLEAVKAGVAVCVERGLMQLDKIFTPTIVENATSTSDGAEWTRRELIARKEARYMSRTRALLRSAFVLTFSDDDIERHVISQLPSVEALDWELAGSSVDASLGQMHFNFLKRHAAWFPRAATLHVVELVSQYLRRGAVSRNALETWTMPISSWCTLGTLLAGDSLLKPLVDALVLRLDDPVLDGDWMSRAQVLSAVDQLKQSGLVAPCDETLLRAALDRRIVAEARRSTERVSEMLEYCRVRHALGNWEPDPSVVDVFVRGYESLGTSTLAGAWLNAVDFFGHYATGEAKSALRAAVDDYVQRTASGRNGLAGPFPEWAATAVHWAVKGSILLPPEGEERLLRLVRKHPECAPFVLALPGVETSEAETIMLRSRAHGALRRGALLRWCDWLPAEASPNPALETVLLGMLFATDGASREEGYWALERLGRRGILSSSARAVLSESILQHGSTDPRWRVRASAMGAAACVRESMGDGQTRALAAVGSADPLAPVRREAERLSGASLSQPAQVAVEGK